MNKITNVNELDLEKKRLEIVLQDKKTVLQANFENVTAKMDPVDKIVSVVTGFTQPVSTKSTLLNTGLNAGINLVMKNTFLGRAGFVTRLVLPILIKKFVQKKIRKIEEKPVHRNILHTSTN